MIAVRNMVRFIRKKPFVFFVSTVLLSLGLMGANLTAIFLRTITKPEPSGFRKLRYETIAESAGNNGIRPVSWQTVEAVQDSMPQLIPQLQYPLVAYSQPSLIDIGYGSSSYHIAVAGASPSFFRNFLERYLGSEPVSDGDFYVVLSDRIARLLFGNPANSIGQLVSIGGRRYQVIGVTSQETKAPLYDTDAWVSPKQSVFLLMGQHSESSGTENMNWKKVASFFIFAATDSAQKVPEADWNKVLSNDALKAYSLRASTGLTSDPKQDIQIATWSRLVFFLSVGILIAASANYSGLLLAQIPKLSEEAHLRRVFGATGWNLLSTFLLAPLVTIGAALLISAICTIGVVESIQRGILIPTLSAFSWSTVVGVLFLDCATGIILSLIVGLLPALRLVHEKRAPQSGYTSTGDRRRIRSLAFLVSLQVGSCILMALIGVTCWQAASDLGKRSLGFETRQLSVVEAMTGAGSDMVLRISDSHEFPLALMARTTIGDFEHGRLKTDSASVASCAPMGAPLRRVHLEWISPSASREHSVQICAVSSEFFRTLRNPIIAGRTIADRSFVGEPTEVVVNRSLVREMWPSGNALDQTIHVHEEDLGLAFTARVVGVSTDMRLGGASSSPESTVFVPLKGNLFSMAIPLYFVVRGDLPLTNIQKIVLSNAEMWVPSLNSMVTYSVDERERRSNLQERVFSYVALIGAGLIGIIALLGLHFMLDHMVHSKRRELAIRISFGASQRDVIEVVARQAIYTFLLGAGGAIFTWRFVCLVIMPKWLTASTWSGEIIVGVTGAVLLCELLVSMRSTMAALRIEPRELLKEQ